MKKELIIPEALIVKKESRFWGEYAKTFHLKNSAACSGLTISKAVALLKTEDAGEKIRAALQRSAPNKSRVIEELSRLAFADVNHAFLTTSGEESLTVDMLRKMDFNCISTIEISDKGGYKVTFLDKSKLLEQLYDLLKDNSNEDSAATFFAALKASTACAKDSD